MITDTERAEQEMREAPSTGWRIAAFLIGIVAIGAALVAHGKGQHKRARTFWVCLFLGTIFRMLLRYVS